MRSELGHTLHVSDKLRTAVLLSMQRALWEHVTSDLRGVAVAWSGEPHGAAQITARFLYEGAVGEDQRECVSETETYVLADFPADTSTSFLPVDYAERELATSNEVWVYLRWEPTPDLQDRPY
jgi:hypothetical protein